MVFVVLVAAKLLNQGGKWQEIFQNMEVLELSKNFKMQLHLHNDYLMAHSSSKGSL